MLSVRCGLEGVTTGGVRAQSPPLEGLKEPVYQGNDTECGLLVMANNLGAGGKDVDYQSENQTYKTIRKDFPEDQEGRKQFTCAPACPAAVPVESTRVTAGRGRFSSDRKRMSTRIKNPDGKGYRIFCKGAAEMVADLCTARYMKDGSVQPFDAAAKAQVHVPASLRIACEISRPVSQTMATIKDFNNEALRTIALAVRELPLLPLDELPF